MATIPTPKTWEDIDDDPDSPDKPTAAEFNEQIKDIINLVTHPKRCMVKHGSDAVIQKDTWTLLTWTAADDADTDDMHSTSSNQSRLVAKTAGVYHVHLMVIWQSGGVTVAIPAGVRGIQIRKNSGGTAGGTEICSDRRRAGDKLNSHMGNSCSGFVEMAENDYVEAYVRHGQDNINFPIPIDDEVDVLHSTAGFVRFSAVWAGTGV